MQEPLKTLQQSTRNYSKSFVKEVSKERFHFSFFQTQTTYDLTSRNDYSSTVQAIWCHCVSLVTNADRLPKHCPGAVPIAPTRPHHLICIAECAAVVPLPLRRLGAPVLHGLTSSGGREAVGLKQRSRGTTAGMQDTNWTSVGSCTQAPHKTQERRYQLDYDTTGSSVGS